MRASSSEFGEGVHVNEVFEGEECWAAQGLEDTQGEGGEVQRR